MWSRQKDTYDGQMDFDEVPNTEGTCGAPEDGPRAERVDLPASATGDVDDGGGGGSSSRRVVDVRSQEIESEDASDTPRAPPGAGVAWGSSRPPAGGLPLSRKQPRQPSSSAL